MAIVYIHTGIDNEEIFYVGIGKSIHRATSTQKRSRLWENYVKAHSFRVTIVEENVSWEEACKKEIELIEKFGRRDLGTGTLVNMTLGGAGGNTMSGKKNPSLKKWNLMSKGEAGHQSQRWINKDGINRRVKEEDLPALLAEGWSKGSLMKNRKKREAPAWNKGMKGMKNPRISEVLSGRKKPTYLRSKITCPHCGHHGDATALKRWHFDKCKQHGN